MTLLSVVKDVCAAVGVIVPTSVFSGIATNRTMQEMLSLANEMAQRIAYDHRDWTILRDISISGTVGDGVKASFPLPANYKRMLLTTNLWCSAHPQVPLRFIPDSDQWIRRVLDNASDSYGEWTLLSGELFIRPTLQVGEVVTYIYLTKNCIKLASGGLSDTFQNDNDSFRLDERLLKLGMVMQWKANKGNAYAEDMGTWQDAMNKAMGADSPAPILIDQLSTSAFARTPYPVGAP